MSNTVNQPDPVHPSQPGGSPSESPHQPARYDSGKGCLLFVALGVVLIAIVVAAIVLFGQPA